MDQDSSNPVDESTPAEEQTPTQEDPIKNVKSEMNRKFDSLNSQFAQLNQALQALASQPRQQQQQQEPAKPLGELIYSDPEAAAEMITQRAVARADQIISSKVDRQEAMKQRVMELTSEFPEFSKGNSEASSIAQRIHAGLPEHLKNTAEGAELAIAKAAMQLGLMPASKRRAPKGEDDSYVPPSSGNPSRRRQSDEGSISDEAYTFAHLLNESIGRKLDDKAKSDLKKYAQRKNWSKYSEGSES